MKLQLDLSVGAERLVFPLDSDNIRVGRSSQNTIQIPDPTVSKEHAEIKQVGGNLVIRDVGSRNGTRVNGVEAAEATPIREGDILEIGKVIARVTRESGVTHTVLSPGPGISSSLRIGAKEILGRAPTGGEASRLVHLLAEAGRVLVLPRPLSETCDEILKFVEQAVPATRLVILLTKDGKAEPEQVAARVRGGSSKQPLSISQSILQAVLHDVASVIIVDAAQDPRFMAQHSIVAQAIHSAMAVPLFDNERVLGVLYADSVDRGVVFGREQLEALTLLANMAAVKITNSRLLEQEQVQQRMAQELATATRIQRTLLMEAPTVENWSLDVRLETCLEVGGDLYDFHVRDDGVLMFLLGDVSGKGMGAALLMSSMLASARTLYDTCTTPAELVARLNHVMYRTTDRGRFVTLFVGWLDPASGNLKYVNAGHNAPFVIDGSNVRRLEAGGVPVGVLPDFPFQSGEETLDHGALLAVYTDGIPEAQRGEAMYEDDRLLAILQRHAEEPMLDALLTRILKNVDEFLGDAPRTDDITLMLLRRN